MSDFFFPITVKKKIPELIKLKGNDVISLRLQRLHYFWMCSEAEEHGVVLKGVEFVSVEPGREQEWGSQPGGKVNF